MLPKSTSLLIFAFIVGLVLATVSFNFTSMGVTDCTSRIQPRTMRFGKTISWFVVFSTKNLITLAFQGCNENNDSETARPCGNSGFSSDSKITGLAEAIGP